MATTGRVQIVGLNRQIRSLQQLGVDVDDIKDAFADVAAVGARTIRHLAPRRRGRLAADVRGNRAKNKAVVTAGRVRVPYAGPINYGWPKRGIRASHFMQRGDRRLEPYAYRRLTTSIDNLTRKRDLR